MVTDRIHPIWDVAGLRICRSSAVSDEFMSKKYCSPEASSDTLGRGFFFD